MKKFKLLVTFCFEKMPLSVQPLLSAVKNRQLLAALVGMFAIFAFASVSANAQICTLTAGAALYRIPETSHYDGTQTSNLSGVGTGDYLFEDGWWFRVAGDTQESFFPTPTITNCAGSTGTISWADVGGRGLFSATNTLNLTSAGANQGVLTLTMSITNLSTVNPLTITLFHGADFDVDGTAGLDSASLLLPNTHMRITDSANGFAEYRASSQFYSAFLVRPFGATTDVFGLLGDTAINNFDNTTIPFGPSDFTGAYQWNLTIPPAGTSLVTAQLSGNSLLVPVTAANVTVDGRVMTDKGGNGISRATVILTDESGTTRTAHTNQFGYFHFDGIESGQSYVVTIQHKQYQFESRFITINEAAELNFTALPE